MRYLMRQKIFSLGDKYVITDGEGRERFVVDGKVFTIGNKLSFQDMDGNELAFIKQRLLSWGSSYDIEVGGDVVATVKKHLFSLLKCRFSVDVPGPDDLEARGSLFDLEYELIHVQDDRPAAQVSKRWFSLRDSYGVEIADGEDDVLILAATVVIDLCCHDGGSGGSD